MKHPELTTALKQMLGPKIGVGITDPQSSGNRLRQVELQGLENAVPKRIREFAAGRAAAREALAEIGHPDAVIPRAEDRSPVWPAGIVGSISHSDETCVAVACHLEIWRSIGVDIEVAMPLHRETWPIILTENERRTVTQVAPWKRNRHCLKVFAIKEAVYKAQYPLTGTLIDFQALTTRIEGSQFAAEFTQPVGKFQPGFVIEGGVLEVGNHIVAGAAIIDF